MALVGFVGRTWDVGHTYLVERILGIGPGFLEDARLHTEGDEMLGAAFPEDVALSFLSSPTGYAIARAAATPKGKPETSGGDGLD